MSSADLSACVGKHPYPTQKSAERGVRRGGLKTYKCDSCGKWHVGTAGGGQKPFKFKRHVLRIE